MPTIDNVTNHSRFEDFANPMIEFGKLAGRKAGDWTKCVVSFCQNTTISKTIQVWAKTASSAFSSVWNGAKSHLSRSLGLVKTPLVSGVGLITLGVGTIFASSKASDPKAKSTLKTLGVLSVFLGLFRFEGLI